MKSIGIAIIVRTMCAVSLALSTSLGFNVAVDYLLGALGGTYPATAYRDAVICSLITAVLFLLADKVSGHHPWLGAAFLTTGAIAAVGGALGIDAHTHSYEVAAAELLFVIPLFWWSIRKGRRNESRDRGVVGL